jgi:hypothetical protein
MLDDRSGDGQGVEQAGIVRKRNVRFDTRIVRRPFPFGVRQPTRCSLHRSGFER